MSQPKLVDLIVPPEIQRDRRTDHRSVVLVDPMDARARACSWRGRSPSGDTVKAKPAYDDLLTLWKNADPDTPILKEARAEYARMP